MRAPCKSRPVRRILALCAWLLLLLLPLVFGCTRRAGPADDLTRITWISGRTDLGFDYEVIRRFEQENHGVRVGLIEMPPSTDKLHDQYATYLVAEDDSIDLYSIDVIWTAEFGSAGWAVPLDALLSPDERAKFLRAPLEACTYMGHIYAIPWYTDAGLLYYRKDLLEAAHIDPPRTWAELVAAARKLQNTRRRGFAFEAAQYEGLVCNFLEYVWGNGGDVLDGKGRVVLDSPQNVEALQFLIDIIYKERITPEAIQTYKEDEAKTDFQNGSAAFIRNWPYVWGLTQQPGEPLLGKVGIAPFPHNDRPGLLSSACLGGWNIMVSTCSKHPVEAAKFATFLTSYEIQRDRLLMTSQLPTREAVFTDKAVLEKHPQAPVLRDIFRLARPRPVTPYYSRLSDILQHHLHHALNREISAEQALHDAARDIRAIPGFEHSVTVMR